MNKNKNIPKFVANTSNIYSVIESFHSFFFLFSISILGFFFLSIFHFIIYGGFELSSFLPTCLGFIVFLGLVLTHRLNKNLDLFNFKNDKHNSKKILFLSIGKTFFVNLYVFKTYSPIQCIHYIKILIKKNNFCDFYSEFLEKDCSYLKMVCFAHSTEYNQYYSYNELLLVKKILNKDTHNLYIGQTLFNNVGFEKQINQRIQKALQNKISDFN